MVHCDGLILCMCIGQGRYTELAIWNPVLGNLKWIQPSDCFTTSDYYGIGYDTASREDYKILRFTDRRYDSDSSSYDDEPEVEIYEFKSNSWRNLVAELDWEVDMSCKGVSVRGNMYWIAHTDRNGYDEAFIQRYFNVAGPDLPPLQFHTDYAHAGYSIGRERNIMVLSEEEVDEGDDIVCVAINLYDIDEAGIKRQIETARHRGYNYSGPYLCAQVYVPSLIPLP